MLAKESPRINWEESDMRSFKSTLVVSVALGITTVAMAVGALAAETPLQGGIITLTEHS